MLILILTIAGFILFVLAALGVDGNPRPKVGWAGAACLAPSPTY